MKARNTFPSVCNLITVTLSITPLAGAIGIVTAMMLVGVGTRAVAAASLAPLGRYSVANGVSGDGSVVVGNSLSGSSYEAFRWTGAGGMVGIGKPPGDYSSYARGANGDGSVVVGGSDYVVDEENLGFRAFRWTAADGMQDLGDLPGGAIQSVALGISADGAVIVGASESASGYEAFRWNAADGMQGLGDLPGGWFQSEANGVSGDGSVIVGYGTTDSDTSEAFRWTNAEGIVSLGVLPGGLGSMALGVSADGSVIVGNSSSGCENGCVGQAFRWTSLGMEGLGVLPGTMNSYAWGVSGDGSVVVGWSESNSDRQAFRWTADGGTQALWDVLLSHGVDPAADGWSRLEFAKAISADGNTIVGDGVRNGNLEAFVAVLDEPLAGDTNDDDVVDLNDLNNVRNNFGATGAELPGDTNNDLIVDLDDLNAVRNNFGASSNAQPVPEPAAWLLSLIGVVATVAACWTAQSPLTHLRSPAC